ncbi:hypothetical protein EXIGLDRAFT_763668 [Exidia glandulosa HHB12029]|uniref:Uncharacterized protein n=1 Tax=Exidia glandulosa HHB12029 TaxID=1314781 RepID=A0A165LV23_EXIGL|nr:hypothetical protein EXIGLDRAFT_763668 [Exidia glandulosa HHB12029]
MTYLPTAISEDLIPVPPWTVHVICTRYKAQLVDTGAIRLLGRFGVHTGGRVLHRLILDGVELRFASQVATLELLALMREIVTQNLNLEKWRYGYGPPVSEYICIW